MSNTSNCSDLILSIGGHSVPIGKRSLVMGILNVTPDSFSDGGKWFHTDRAIEHGMQLIQDGADWLDIGGESTRPGAEPVDEQEELRRTIPVIEALTRQTDVPVSIDTYKASVAQKAIEAGASIINDVTGFRDQSMVEVAVASDAALVCMHMKGTPQTMKQLAQYDDVVQELHDYFVDKLELLTNAGVDVGRIVLDPGIGFAKNLDHNLLIMRNLDRFLDLQRPLLLGASRKRLIGELTGANESERMAGTLTTTIATWYRGVRIFRVHDVKETKSALKVLEAIEQPTQD